MRHEKLLEVLKRREEGKLEATRILGSLMREVHLLAMEEGIPIPSPAPTLRWPLNTG